MKEYLKNGYFCIINKEKYKKLLLEAKYNILFNEFQMTLRGTLVDEFLIFNGSKRHKKIKNNEEYINISIRDLINLGFNQRFIEKDFKELMSLNKIKYFKTNKLYYRINMTNKDIQNFNYSDVGKEYQKKHNITIGSPFYKIPYKLFSLFRKNKIISAIIYYYLEQHINYSDQINYLKIEKKYGFKKRTTKEILKLVRKHKIEKIILNRNSENIILKENEKNKIIEKQIQIIENKQKEIIELKQEIKKLKIKQKKSKIKDIF